MIKCVKSLSLKDKTPPLRSILKRNTTAHSPIMISSESEMSDSFFLTSENSDSEEKPISKKYRLSDEEDKVYVFERDEEEYSKMHDKEFKDMSKTKENIKQKFMEWWPEKQSKLLGKLYDKERKPETKKYALRRLKECIGVHLCCKKLNEGDYEPLNELEQPLQGVTIECFEEPCNNIEKENLLEIVNHAKIVLTLLKTI